MSKRPRHASFDTAASPESESPTTKRARIQSSPIRPRTSLSLLTPSPYHTFRTPLSVPSDSPNNPFGLKRSLIALELPPQTPFRKHLTLRFQLVDAKRRVGKVLRGGVFRVVQVPLAYTFRHLHKLILFLFATDIEQMHAPAARPAAKRRGSWAGATKVPRAKASSAVVGPSKSKGKGRAAPSAARGPAPRTWGGHYFETVEGVDMERESVRPGAIKPTAQTWLKSSSVRDRRLFKDVYDPLGLSPDDSPNPLDEDEPDDGSWKWEAEDDLTLGSVWFDGPNLDRGIIYHHTPDVSVHITVNAMLVPPRRGWGNEPHVFLAQGSGESLVRIAHVTTDERGRERTVAANDTFETGAAPVAKAQIDRWNVPGAFGAFLHEEAARERALRRHASPSPSSSPVPQLLYDDRSSSTTADLLPSSSSDDPAFGGLASELEVEGDLLRYASDGGGGGGVVFPFASSSALTPYPANPLRRRRVECAERRLSRLTQSGLREVMSEDEEDVRRRAREREEERLREEEEAEALALEKAERERVRAEARAVKARAKAKAKASREKEGGAKPKKEARYEHEQEERHPVEAATEADPPAKIKAPLLYRELLLGDGEGDEEEGEGEEEFDRDEEGNVWDLFGIYESEV